MMLATDLNPAPINIIKKNNKKTQEIQKILKPSHRGEGRGVGAKISKIALLVKILRPLVNKSAQLDRRFNSKS